MEEDIKVVEGLCRCFRYEQSKLDELDRDNYADFIQEDEIKAIENLIARNKELEEDNYAYHQLMQMQNKREYRSKFLKDFKAEYGENVMPDYDEIYKRYDKMKKQLEDSIPKSKVREKIEERYGKLCIKLGSYIRDEGTSEQERIAGGINELRKLKQKLLQEGDK